MEVRELLQQIHEKRLTIRARQAELMANIEANLEGETAEDKIKWEGLDKEFKDLGQRQEMLMSQAENDKQLDEQRARFEKVVRDPHQVERSEHAFENRMRNWLKAGLPDAEVWAPKTITINFDSMAARPHNDGRIELHDLTRGTATDGAELVATGFVRTLQEHLIESNGVRRTNAQVFTTATGDSLLVPATTGHGTATLVTEGGAFLENDAQFKQVNLGAYKFGQLIQVSTELVTDAAVDLLGYLARAAGTAIGTVQEGYFVTGTGTSQPEGVAATPTVGKTGTTGQTLTVIANDLIDLYHSVVSGYRARGYWLMDDLSAAVIRKLRDDTGGSGLGNFVWQPGLQAGTPDTIFGRPVVTSPSMADMGVSAYSIAFGDFSAFYAIRDVGTLQFDRSDDFAFSTGLVSFRSSLRSDAKQLINGASGAVKFYRNSAT